MWTEEPWSRSETRTEAEQGAAEEEPIGRGFQQKWALWSGAGRGGAFGPGLPVVALGRWARRGSATASSQLRVAQAGYEFCTSLWASPWGPERATESPDGPTTRAATPSFHFHVAGGKPGSRGEEGADGQDSYVYPRRGPEAPALHTAGPRWAFLISSSASHLMLRTTCPRSHLQMFSSMALAADSENESKARRFGRNGITRKDIPKTEELWRGTSVQGRVANPPSLLASLGSSLFPGSQEKWKSPRAR
ncbi:uncharacterized protein PS065_017094 [Dugong dugon]